MPQTIQITGIAFQINTAVQGTDSYTIVLSYTQPPTSVSQTGPNDALNPNNYTLSGPAPTSVVDVIETSSLIFTLRLSQPLRTGDYVLTVNNVQSNGGGLIGPNQVTIHCLGGEPKEPLVQGHESDDAAALVRRFLPTQYHWKTAWEALIAGVAAGDTLVKENAFRAFAQLFMSSASGSYLVQRAADFGIEYPSAVGMSDALFRKLAVKSTNKKLVHQALLELLDIFYEADSTRANTTTTVSEPYALTDGDAISFRIDDRSTVTVTFRSADFADITNATAAEVAGIISRTLRDAGQSAYALVKQIDGLNYVRVYSGALGLLGSISVINGIANDALRFPTILPFLATVNPNLETTSPAEWVITLLSQTELRFTWNAVDWIPSGYDPLFDPTVFFGYMETIQPGDIAVVKLSAEPDLRGAYEVTEVHVETDFNVGNGQGLTWFSVKPSVPFPWGVGNTSTVLQADVDEIYFYRPTRRTVINNLNASYIAQHSPSTIEAVLPATTSAVYRSQKAGAYVYSQPEIAIDTVDRVANVLTVTTLVPHGYTTGDMVEIFGVQTAIGSGRFDVVGVVDVTTPYVFTMPSVDADGSGDFGFAVSLNGQGSNVVGPFVLNPVDDFAITGVSTITTMELPAGHGVSTLTVADTRQFPTGEHYIVIGFGTQYETGPIKSFGKLDAQTLLLDRLFTPPLTIPSDADVTVLSQLAPLDSEVPSVGLFYLTDSNSGRVAAQAFLADSAAAGVNLVQNVIYPGDRGLAGEGLPTTGQKISDKVSVWAGDIDAELAGAQNG